MSAGTDQYYMLSEGRGIMEGLRTYALTLVTAALLISVVLNLQPEGISKELVRILCGIILTCAVIKPIVGWRLPYWGEFLHETQTAAQVHVETGTQLVRDSMDQYISQQLAAYIWDKADLTETDAQICFTMNEKYLPQSVRITGKFSEKEREWIEVILTQDLGIPKEAQEWIG